MSNKKCILIVDDDQEDLEMITEAFAEIEGVSLQTFSSSLSILKYLKANNPLPSLVITDYYMPTIDGFNLVSFIKRREDFCSIPVTVLSGGITNKEKQRLISAGAFKVFAKPGTFKEYVSIARELEQFVGCS